MRKLTDKEINQAIALRRNGHSLTSLARQFNVHFTTIALWTGSEENRKKKLTYKKQIREDVLFCSSCGGKTHGDEKYCDCRFPTLVKRYFFSPNDI